MFMGRNSNNNNGVNVNTNLYVSYSDTCMLKMGAWNNNLSIKFHPFKGVNADGVRQYAQDSIEVTSTSLTTDNATALLDGIRDVIKPAISEGKDTSVSIAMGANENRKVMSIFTKEGKVHCSIAINVDDDGKTAESNVITHTFNTKDYVVGYSASNGGGTIVTTQADFENFVEKLTSIYKITGEAAHSINYSNAIKASFSNKSGGNFNSQPTPAVGGYQAPVSNVSGNDMSDFLPFQ